MSGGTRFARPAGDEHFLNSWSLHPVEGLGGPSPFLAFSPSWGPLNPQWSASRKLPICVLFCLAESLFSLLVVSHRTVL